MKNYILVPLFILMATSILGQTIQNDHEIDNTTYNFNLDIDDRFGVAVDAIGDLNNDGVTDIVVGANGDDDGGTDRGAVYVLFMNNDNTVNSFQKISATEGNFGGTLQNGGRFGTSVAFIGDYDNDSKPEIAVGAELSNDGGTEHGEFWIIELNTDGTVNDQAKISETSGNFNGTLDDNASFGSAIDNIGDLNNDGVDDLVVGSRRSDGGGTREGAVWVLFMNANWTVSSHQQISTVAGNFGGSLDDDDYFGCGVTNMGDFDGDGITDIVVGAYRDDGGGTNTGSVWFVYLNTDGTAKGFDKIRPNAAGFNVTLNNDARFGMRMDNCDDVDGDGISDLIVSCAAENVNFTQDGSSYLLLLNSDATVKTIYKIAKGSNGFNGDIQDGDFFGRSVACISSTTGSELKVGIGAIYNEEGTGQEKGAVWVMDLKGITTAVEDYVSGNNITLYPNPVTNNVLNLSNINHIKTIKIIDANGRAVKDISAVEKSINVSELSTGIYYVIINTESESIVYKVVKQ